MIALLLALLVVYAWWAPESWLGLAIGHLAAKAARRLRAIRPSTILCVILVTAAFAALIAYGKIEGIILTAFAAPEVFATFLAIDVGIAVEVLTLAVLAAGRSNLRRSARRLQMAVRTLVRWAGACPRARRVRHPRRHAKPANDDDAGAADLEPAKARAA